MTCLFTVELFSSPKIIIKSSTCTGESGIYVDNQKLQSREPRRARRSQILNKCINVLPDNNEKNISSDLKIISDVNNL